MKHKIAITLWALFLLGIGAVIMLFYGIREGWVGYLPPLEELQNPKNRYASEIFFEDGVSMGRYYQKENRIGVQYSDIAPCMIEALIATEDARFYDHTGVDVKALARAILKLGKAGGGSTITQQLAKQVWSPTADNIFERALQKPIEWVIATQLERFYSKDEIITMYLNQFDFLYNAVGIQSAAQVYFNTTPARLKTEEAAMLVGMCKNPALYNPRRHVERCTNRRNTVLSQMEKYGYLTKAECDSLSALPITLHYRKADHKEGPAPYYREMLRKVLTAKEPNESNYPSWNKQQYKLDRERWEKDPLYGFCNKATKADGSHYDLYQDGLRIHTTLDSRLQQYAEEAVREHMSTLQAQFFRECKRKSTAPFSEDLTSEEVDGIMNRAMRNSDRYRIMKRNGASDEEIRKAFNTKTDMRVFSYDGIKDTTFTPLDSIRYNKTFLRCGFMSINPNNGHVKAYVGGPDFTHFQYDMASLGRRQIGSTVKPYLYTLAMEEGMWPCEEVVNDSVTFLLPDGSFWTPHDDHTKNQGEMVTLNWGLQQSSNWVSAHLMSMFTPEKLVDLMHSFGIKGYIDPVVSLCLGPCEISVEEMTDAYTTFVNRGIRVEPLYVTHIEDNSGNVIATFVPETHEVISQLAAFKMITMLRNVVDFGTGRRLRFRYGFKAPMGGKTGTTQNNSDGWFVGITPDLVNGAWVGGEDRSIHFDNMSQGQGSAMALPIWAEYMKRVYADTTLHYSQDTQFDIPAWFDPNAGCK